MLCKHYPEMKHLHMRILKKRTIQIVDMPFELQERKKTLR